MNFILDIIRGAVIGVANIIPGVSGGTMMVTMGIYDKLIGSITGIFKQFKKSIKTLLPYGIGMVVGIVAFAFLLKKVLIPKFPLPTAFAFIGLIVGGVPVLVKKALNAGNGKSEEKVDGAVFSAGSVEVKTERNSVTERKNPHGVLCVLVFVLKAYNLQIKA